MTAKRIIIAWFIFQALASLAFAGTISAPLSGCLTSLPGGEVTINFSKHVRIAAFEQSNLGCNPTDDRANPTAGMYSREFFLDGSESVTISEAGFNRCKDTQFDIQDVDEVGTLGATYAFIFLAKPGANCSASYHHEAAPPQITNVSEVPEPASMMLMGSGLIYLLRKRLHK